MITKIMIIIIIMIERKFFHMMEIVSYFHLVPNSLDMIGHFLMTAILSENVATYLSLLALTL